MACWGRFARLRWGVVLLLGFSGVAAALSLSPDVQRGLAWLETKVASSGLVTGEDDSIATAFQNRDEALRTLQLLSSGNPALEGALGNADASATEYLARQALSLRVAHDVSVQLAALVSRQNGDGGVGAMAGGLSTALDSAWALAALSQQPAQYSASIHSLKTYLYGQLWLDGGLSGLSASSRMEASSLMLLALQALTPDLGVSNALHKLSVWLAQAQSADGSWGGDLYLTAYALAALSPVSADSTQQQAAASFLKAQQAVDGSWNNDPFITAVILRALAQTGKVATAAPANSVVGQVLSASGNLPLSGVSITVSGSSITAVTDSQGKFALVGLPAGSQQISFILTGYQGRAITVSVPSGSQLNVGAILLSPVVGVGSLSGVVLDVDSRQPLAAATVSLASNPAISVQTDATGHYQISNLAPGTFPVTVTAGGYSDLSYVATVSAGTNLLQFNLRKQATPNLNPDPDPLPSGPATLRGQAVDLATGVALAGVQVLVNQQAVMVTDANGNFSLSLAAGSYQIDYQKSGYLTVTYQVTVTAGSSASMGLVQLRAQPSGPAILSGQTIALGTGEALAGVQILVNQQAVATTPASGNFSLSLAAGSYRIDYQKSGYLTLSQQVTVTAGSSASLGLVQLIAQRTTTRLSGVIHDGETQQVMAGATVQIVGGESVSTDSTGHYVLDNIAATEFDVRVSAPAYNSKITRLSVSFPGDVTYDVSLMPQAGQGMQITALGVSPMPAGLRTDTLIATSYQNTGSELAAIIPTLQLLDENGNVVSAAVAYASATDAVPMGVFNLDAGASKPIFFKWNSGQFPSGHYLLIARASAAGTITRSNLLGTVLAERQGGLDIIAEEHLSGSLTATPPVQQAGNVQPVHLTALVQNDGNVDSQSRMLKARLEDEKTGATVTTLTATLSALPVSQLANVDFGSWSPITPGSYRVHLLNEANETIASPARVYIGDAAKGFFTVNKTLVPTGTQTLKANVALQGVDPVTGEITDPLAPLIKAAIQKAVTYNDTESAAWVARGKCGGCHLGAQAIVGGEANNGFTTYDLTKRRQVIGQIVALQETDSGGFEHEHSLGFGRTHTTMAMWGLSSVQDKTPIISNVNKGIYYVLNVQEGAGHWVADHDPNLHWWSTSLGATSLNVHSLITYSNYLKANPGLTFPWYKPQNDYGQITNWAASLKLDAAKNLYVSYSGPGYLEKITPTGTRQTLLSGYPDLRQVLPRPNGDLYACYQNGVLKRLADGTVKQISNVHAWGIVESATGEIYVASHTAGTIYKLINDQLVPFVSAPLVHHIAIGRDGYLYYTRWGLDVITRVAANGVQTVVGRNPDSAYASYMVQLPNGNWAVSGWFGLHIMDESFSYPIAKVFRGDVYGLEVLDGKLIFAPNVSGHKLWQYTPEYTPDHFGIPNRLDPALQKARSWLLAANSVTGAWIQARALQIIALAELQEYFGTDPAVTAKLQSLEASLRAVQNTDGSWGAAPGGASDPLVTAQVGYALYKLNPSPDDPALKKAILWALSKQGADGSWHSGQLATNVATTTWVAIWLPIALNRVGGIDTDVHLSFPSDIHLSNPSLAPTDSSANADGSTNYHWNLLGVTTNGRNIDFDLTLDNLLPNEQRSVAATAELRFNNSFTNS